MGKSKPETPDPGQLPEAEGEGQPSVEPAPRQKRKRSGAPASAKWDPVQQAHVVPPADAPHVATDETRARVERYVACGLDVSQIAFCLGTDPATVSATYKQEIEHGAFKVNAQVGDALIAAALKGDVNAARFFLGARARWAVATKIEHTGKDGGPIEVEEKRKLVERIVGRMAEMAKPPAPEQGKGRGPRVH